MPTRTASRSAHRGGRDEARVARFVERFALELAASGFQRMAARVFAALLACEAPSMTARELADRLQVSPAAVSGAVRYLEQARLVRRVREPGERTDRFVLGDDAWYEAIADRSEIFDGLLSALAEGLVAVGDGSVAGQRIAETSEFFAYLKDEMPLLIERWRSSRAVPTPRSSPRR